MDSRYDKFIKRCLEKQLITGSLDYIKKVEKLVGLRLREKKKKAGPKKYQKREKKW